MGNPASFLKWIVAAWLAATAGLVFYRFLTGRIRTHGFLCEACGGQPLPERIQLLAITVAGSGAYVMAALSQGTLPEIPSSLIALVGGSQALYLIPKAVRHTGRT